jgi:signal transduction histidine kinase
MTPDTLPSLLTWYACHIHLGISLFLGLCAIFLWFSDRRPVQIWLGVYAFSWGFGLPYILMTTDWLVPPMRPLFDSFGPLGIFTGMTSTMGLLCAYFTLSNRARACHKHGQWVAIAFVLIGTSLSLTKASHTTTFLVALPAFLVMHAWILHAWRQLGVSPSRSDWPLLASWWIFWVPLGVWGLLHFGFSTSSDLAILLTATGQCLVYFAHRILILSRARAHQQEIQRQREHTRSHRRLRNYLRILCHDINNQIQAVMGMAELMKIMPANSESETSSRVTKMEQALLRQVELIKHVRTLRAVEDGKASLTMEPTPLGSSVQEVLETFGRAIAEKNLVLDGNFSSGGDFLVLAEPVSLKHSVLGNFLGNAIKFAPPGGKITIRFLRTHRLRAQRVVVDIEDNGPGIPAAKMDDIFEPSEHASQVSSAVDTSTYTYAPGLGMHLANTYMRLYGGAVEISSQTADTAEQNVSTGTSIRLIFMCPE